MARTTVLREFLFSPERWSPMPDVDVRPWIPPRPPELPPPANDNIPGGPRPPRGGGGFRGSIKLPVSLGGVRALFQRFAGPIGIVAGAYEAYQGIKEFQRLFGNPVFPVPISPSDMAWFTAYPSPEVARAGVHGGPAHGWGYYWYPALGAYYEPIASFNAAINNWGHGQICRVTYHPNHDPTNWPNHHLIKGSIVYTNSSPATIYPRIVRKTGTEATPLVHLTNFPGIAVRDPLPSRPLRRDLARVKERIGVAEGWLTSARAPSSPRLHRALELRARVDARGGSVTARPAPARPTRPPRPPRREPKSKPRARGVVGVLKILRFTTDFLENTEILWDALPKELTHERVYIINKLGEGSWVYKEKWFDSYIDKVIYTWSNAMYADIPTLLRGIVYDEVTDRVIGELAGTIQKRFAEMGWIATPMTDFPSTIAGIR